MEAERERRRKERKDGFRQARTAAESADRARSAFLAAMSHELRTPLNAIIGFGELLEDGSAGKLTPRQGRYVGHIVQSGRHLLEMIEGILEFSSTEPSGTDLENAERPRKPAAQDDPRSRRLRRVGRPREDRPRG